MATYNYDTVGFPSTANTGDLLIVGTSTYIYTAKGTWDSHSGTAGAAGSQGVIGDTGATGPTGAAGADSTVAGPQGGQGTTGDSAYQSAVTGGFTGTEAEWVAQIGSKGGYEFTGGFTDRVSGTAGASDIGNDVEFTQTMVDANAWLRFGFDATRQQNNDTPYWGDSSTNPLEAPHSGTTDFQGVGLFSGAYMPSGVTSMFNFTDNTTFNAASTSGSLQYNAATGSYNMSQMNTGDHCSFRFDFNLTPQFANTTVEVGLIWATRDASGNVTYTFALTGEPLFYGAGTTGETFLNRPVITAYLASDEDVNARALPAIRSDQPVFIQPLTTLYTIGR